MTANPVYRARSQPDHAQIRLLTDIVFFTGSVWILMPQATGILLHEWSSLWIVIPLLIHLVLNWRWIITLTARFFKRQPGQTRFNFFWDWFLFAMTVTAFFSGIVISEQALPGLGIPIVVDPFWTEVHLFTANSVTIMLGVHLAMHWQWLFSNLKRTVLRRSVRNGGDA